MRILSYSESEQQDNQIKIFIRTLDNISCHLSFQGTDDNGGFNMFLDAIQKEDTVVFLSMKQLFNSIEQLLMFLRFCMSQDIRIISIMDEIDTKDVIFPLPCSSHWLEVLCSLKSSTGNEHDDAKAELIGNTGHDRMLKRHRMVVNLYSAGYTIREILRLTGYKSKTHLYRNLKRYGIDIEFPSMQRKKQSKNPKLSPYQLAPHDVSVKKLSK